MRRRTVGAASGMQLRLATCALVVGALVLGTLTGCTSGDDRADEGTSPSPTGDEPGQTPTATATPTPKPLPWGPMPKDLADAADLVATWTPEQLAGGVTVARYGGTDPGTPASLVKELHLAGVIVMGDNVAGADQVAATAVAVQQAAADDGRDWPAIVSVDQEGGRVERFTGEVTAFPTLMTGGAAVAGDPDTGARAVSGAAQAAGAQLRALGFTWVNAPVADVTIGPSDPTIGSRSPSADPALASRVVVAAVEGYREAAIVPVVKHYPGHGSVTVDSHEALPVQDASLAALRARDLAPFAQAAKAGAPVVMMSHLAVDAFEPGVPSTLSSAAYASLRSDAGFEGVAITDALDMAAVTAEYGAGGAAVKALAAGADVLLMPSDVEAAHAAVAAAITDGTVPRTRAEEAAAKVVALQRWQARTSAQTSPASGGAGNGAGLADAARAASRSLSAAGVTRIDGPCTGALVDDTVQVVGADRADRLAFTDAAEDAGLDVAPPGGQGTVVRLLGSGRASGSGDVVVALDTPYPLASSRGNTATLALYGRSPSAFSALVDVLTGAATAPGALPVSVDGLSVDPC